nr:immunoglobulin light chain junction region [Macaca mulatta]
CMQGIHLPYTC